ncbi:MAG: AarF/ABC1/UbiB kinase family protein [Firmicutes bacterium]|nr:AarF/ABC1/UbiB kinase family protein [Alicyclobacillaceae bacterium]MCL6497489.1 AarF/ABC1/UbiB kinase family protein [Bacillota bacterium]
MKATGTGDAESGRKGQAGASRRMGWAALQRTAAVVGLFLAMAWAVFWHGRWQPAGAEADASREALWRQLARRFRIVAERQGGLLIKVGQFLSSRVDLLPKPFIEELQELQDAVPPAPWPLVRAVLEHELGPIAERFADFDPEPVAAASLGQVYRGRLPSGEEVAVKIQRPAIQSLVSADLVGLEMVVALLSRFTRFGRTFDLPTVLREFRHMVAQELDYRHELDNTERLRATLAHLPWVRVPRTYPELSTGRVLTMEFWRGIKVNQRQALVDAGVDVPALAQRLIHLYLFMVLDAGFFHADPHPGNLLVLPGDGAVVLLDYGMVGRIEMAQKRQIRRLFTAVTLRQPSELVESLRALGMIRPEADLGRLRREVRYLLDRYYAETLDQLARLDVVHLMRDLEGLLREEAVQIPGEFAFLGRAIAILVGLATALDPNINLIDLFAPYVQRLMTEERGGVTGMVRSGLRRWSQAAAAAPELIFHLLQELENGEFEAQWTWNQGADALRGLAAEVSRLTRAIWVVGLWLVAVGLVTHGHPGWAALAAATGAAILVRGWLGRPGA